ncbi:ABC transporter ATP-binding protein [Galactobacter caseinivorans]|uniref:ABC transporter ATP-binding protein n=1 Tax=Galactobacter caseinivorans TaxID=2676123 RepID=A0A496PIG9_9MICC|nr:ABC transporter ATP-binding protein [Galactobacter caseinivorans]RKW70281.1 ABC transporter ATP-binding protein [Galactobacter caseinivorans]
MAVQDLTLNYGGADIVKRLSLSLPAGQISVIVGANGCGKSTLLRGLSRLLRPAGGSVTLDGADVHRMAPKALARRVALLPQSPITPEALTVRELVAHGRAPYRSALRREGAEDRAAIERALAATQLQGLAESVVADLSGGQRQRAWIAMALAQETDVLLLDEPTTFLDLAHQVDVLQTVWELNARRGTTVIMVLHDLNLAARYAHHLVALREGELVAQGTPQEVVTTSTVRTVFGLETVVVPDPVAGTPMVVPLAGNASPPTSHIPTPQIPSPQPPAPQPPAPQGETP